MLTASVLMVGVPWAMAFVEEQQIMEMERTERAREVAGEVSVFFSSSFFFLFLFFGRFFVLFSLFCFGGGIIYIYCGLFSWFGKFLWRISFYALCGPSLGGFFWEGLILSLGWDMNANLWMVHK